MKDNTYVVFKFKDEHYRYPIQEVQYQGDFLELIKQGKKENWTFNYAKYKRGFAELEGIEIVFE